MGCYFFSSRHFFFIIGRKTEDEYVELSWRSRLLPKASVSYHSSLIFPEPQAHDHIDCKNLFTVCLFGRYLTVKVLSRMGSIVLLKVIMYSC